jgi:ABC-type multidrug transport system fused ATPase/permease subunit
LVLGCSVDGLNISAIGLLDLRRRLAIIPQDAALFEGTIRDNLDPRHVHDDTELWSVLGAYQVVGWNGSVLIPRIQTMLD